MRDYRVALGQGSNLDSSFRVPLLGGQERAAGKGHHQPQKLVRVTPALQRRDKVTWCFSITTEAMRCQA
jgi:hypothetical protein